MDDRAIGFNMGSKDPLDASCNVDPILQRFFTEMKSLKPFSSDAHHESVRKTCRSNCFTKKTIKKIIKVLDFISTKGILEEPRRTFVT